MEGPQRPANPTRHTKKITRQITTRRAPARADAARAPPPPAAEAHVTSSRHVSSSLRTLIVALRWLRTARALTMLVKTAGAGSTAARQATGNNKRRFVDLDANFDLVCSRPLEP